MSQTKNTNQYNLQSIVVAQIFDSAHAPSHDQKWSQLGADDAPLVRAALVRASSLSLLNVKPNDAYLRGIADALTYAKQLNLMKRVRESDLPLT